MTTLSFRRTGRRVAAFTLIELLTSMAVLLLLVVAVTQIVNGTTTLSTANRQHLDADSQARLVFDRMALDFGRMLKRPDVDYIFAPQTGDDKFFFYTEAPGFFYSGGTAVPASVQSPLSLAGYRVNGQSQKYPYQLSRLGKGLEWDESNAATEGATEPASIVFLTPSGTPLPLPTPATVPATTPVPTPLATTTLSGRWPKTVGTTPGFDFDESDATAAGSYHVIADGVCRLEVCFLLKPRPATAAGAAQPARYSLDPFYKVDGQGNPDPQHSAVYGLQDVQAIVVALAVLDRTTRQRVSDLSHLKTALRDIAAADLDPLPPSVSTNPATLMANIWQREIDSGNLAADAQIPRGAVSQLRVYQRHFYLDTH